MSPAPITPTPEPENPPMSEADWKDLRGKVERALAAQARTGLAGVIVAEVHVAPQKPPDIRCRIAARVY